MYFNTIKNISYKRRVDSTQPPQGFNNFSYLRNLVYLALFGSYFYKISKWKQISPLLLYRLWKKWASNPIEKYILLLISI